VSRQPRDTVRECLIERKEHVIHFAVAGAGNILPLHTASTINRSLGFPTETLIFLSPANFDLGIDNDLSTANSHFISICLSQSPVRISQASSRFHLLPTGLQKSSHKHNPTSLSETLYATSTDLARERDHELILHHIRYDKQRQTPRSECRTKARRRPQGGPMGRSTLQEASPRNRIQVVTLWRFFTR
jgi:hypothetical protein